jgi:hypothetical protein
MKCQNGSGNLPIKQSNKPCYFCLDSIEYVGLVTLRTDYMALNEINADLSLRFNLLDKSYLECRSLLETSVIKLEATNYSRDSLMLVNKQYEYKVNDLNNKLKSWKIFGVTVSAASILGIIVLVLT